MQLRTGINYTNIDDNNLSLLGDELRPEGNISVGFAEFIEATAKKTFQLLPIGNFVDAYQKTNAMREAGELREPEPFEQYLAGNATYYAEGKVKDFTKDEYRMSKEAWEKSEYYRADIDYQEDMTETLAKMLAENYDNARYRDALLNMRAENNTGLGQVMDTAAGFVTAMGVGIIDPINWIPFARALGVGAKAVGTVGKSFIQGAKAGAFEGAISMAISEAMVFERQRALGEKDLTIADSVTNIAASALLGGLIGGAVRSYKFSKMTPEERALAEAGLADKTILLDEILLTDKLPHPLQEKADQFFLDLNFSDPKTFQFYIDMMPEASLADLIDLFALATHDLESGIKIDVVNTFLNNERLLNDVVRTYNVASLMGMHKNAPDLTLENFKEFLQLEKKKAEATFEEKSGGESSKVDPNTKFDNPYLEDTDEVITQRQAIQDKYKDNVNNFNKDIRVTNFAYGFKEAADLNHNLNNIYDKAKQGNDKSAKEVIKKTFSKNSKALENVTKYIDDLYKEHGDNLLIFFAQKKGETANAMPSAYAKFLINTANTKYNSNWKALEDVFQLNMPFKRRGLKSDIQKLIYGSEFYSQPIDFQGSKVLVVDDEVGSGRVLLDATRFLASQGADIVGFTALRTSPAFKNESLKNAIRLDRSSIAVRKETRDKLFAKFGEKPLAEVLAKHNIAGGNPRWLTESEAQILLHNFKDANDVDSGIGIQKDAGTESVLAEYGLLGRGDLDGLRKSRKERGTSGVGSKTDKGTNDTTTANTNGQDGTNTEGAGGNNANQNRTQSDRPIIKDRDDFPLSEQNQIYGLDDQMRELNNKGKLTDQDLDTLVNQPNKALSEADKLDEATKYIMDCIKGAV